MTTDKAGLTALAERVFRRRRKPNWQTLALTFEDAFRVMERKSLWMVEYIRGRRDGDRLTPFYRRQYLRERRALASKEPTNG